MSRILMVTVFHSRSGSTAICDYIANSQGFAGYQELFHRGNDVQSFHSYGLSFNDFMAALLSLELNKPITSLSQWKTDNNTYLPHFDKEEKRNIAFVHFKVNVLTLITYPRLLFYLLKNKIPIIILHRDMAQSALSSARVYAGDSYHSHTERSKRCKPNLLQLSKAYLVQLIQKIILFVLFVIFKCRQSPVDILNYSPNFLDCKSLSLFNSKVLLKSSGSNYKR